MIKKLVSLGTFIALIPAAWANPWIASTSTPYTSDSYYNQNTFAAGIVFRASVSGFGPGNGVSFAETGGSYLVFVGPGTGSAQSFSGSGSSSPLSVASLVSYGVSATSNGPGAYCTSELTAGW